MQRHDLDGVSLTFGLVFLAVTAVWALGEVAGQDLPMRWAVPGILALAGIAWIVSALSGRSTHPHPNGAPQREVEPDGEGDPAPRPH